MASGPALFTGNNVDVYIGNNLFGFVETITISRSVNRRNVYAVGSAKRVDAPVTQITVTVQATCLVPLTASASRALQQPGAVVVHNKLTDEVNSDSVDIKITQKNNAAVVLASVTNCFFNDDAETIPNTDILSYNLSWTGDDTSIFTVNN